MSMRVEDEQHVFLIRQKKEAETLNKQQKLKEYLNTFYQRIYSTRMLIQMHMEIANFVQTKSLLNDQYWACMQVSIFVSQIATNIFAIFDENKKNVLKQFIAFLRQFHDYSLDEEITRWFDLIRPYEDFR